MELSALHKKLLPCDMGFSFVFVSYSFGDKEVVYSGIIELPCRLYVFMKNDIVSNQLH